MRLQTSLVIYYKTETCGNVSYSLETSLKYYCVAKYFHNLCKHGCCYKNELMPFNEFHRFKFDVFGCMNDFLTSFKHAHK